MYKQFTENGKVRFFESYYDPKTRTRKRASVTMDRDTAVTRKRAAELLSVKIKRLQGRTYEDTHLTLKGLLEAYKASRKPVLREQTMTSHMYTLQGALDVLGPNTFVDELTAGYILRKFDVCKESATWKNEKIKRLKTMLRWAYRMELIPSVDWLEKVPKYEDNAKARREQKYLEPEELDRLLKAMEITVYRQLTLFLALTGLRIGEALALRPADIDAQNRLIHVTKTFIPQLHREGPTKTDGSTRDVYIQSELLPLLREMRPGTYLFQGVNYDAYRKYLKNAGERSLHRNVVPHTLRHTHTSLLAAAGVPIETISRRLGHQDTKITLEIYMHVTKQLQERDRALIEGALLTQKLQKSYTQ